ncbi:hypothetical protein [Rubrobacter calidifluminis]|uniref:hypothetical protein n=1 Tax=Rubrobacter calidifluminis TaxID=1392640 RepID=UPI00235E9F5D|nr:hypothetical protein [Rubrobacter calidifluminis]
MLYGRGLCFGMAAASLAAFCGVERRWPRPLSRLSPDPALIGELRRYHLLQFRPRTILRVVWEWMRARGGRPERVAGRIRVAGDPDPHILCLGPRAGRGFFERLALAHAVVPYRLEEVEERLFVYVYDPEFPKDRKRKIVFRRGGGEGFGRFRYGRFDSREGWGIVPLQLSAVLSMPGRASVCDPVSTLEET